MYRVYSVKVLSMQLSECVADIQCTTGPTLHDSDSIQLPECVADVQCKGLTLHNLGANQLPGSVVAVQILRSQWFKRIVPEKKSIFFD